MSLNWSWKEKCGYMDVTYNNNEFQVQLYQGNAYLIMLYEFEEDGKNMWQMWNFFADDEHMKRCLGLRKGYNNLFENGIVKRMVIDIDKNSYWKKIIECMYKACPDTVIEIRRIENESV